MQFSLKPDHICKSNSKKTMGSRFYGTQCMHHPWMHVPTWFGLPPSPFC